MDGWARRPGSATQGEAMSSRPKNSPRPSAKPGARPGATHEQVDRRARFEQARRESLAPGDDTAVLYGWHTVKAALENPARRAHKLLATENAARRLAEDVKPQPEIVRPDAIAARLPPEAVHQGLYLEADPLPSPAIEELAPSGIVLVLDQITDPHNVGAIFRSAAAFAVSAIVTTTRHSPEATGVLAKAASGALEHVPLVAVQNLARTLATLKERGFQVVGLDSDGNTDLAGLPLKSPLALVLGAEGKGLRQLTKQTCDHVARLELPGPIQSLNVSNAAAVALYVARSRLS
jgi:23S rRNA (guanosine2251-2'-O)-methyltransferase